LPQAADTKNAYTQLVRILFFHLQILQKSIFSLSYNPLACVGFKHSHPRSS
jgi:hypothetical protein